MRVVDLKLRAYDILGDVAANPLFFPWSRILQLMNDGVAFFRASVGDRWGWTRIPTVAGVAEYDFPDTAHRLIRVAYAGLTLDERSRLFLDDLDWNWKNRTGKPTDYTLDGLGFERYRLFPIPTESSGDQVVFVKDALLSPASLQADANHGKAVRWIETGGASKVFAVDPYTSPGSPNYGFLVKGATTLITPGYGKPEKAMADVTAMQTLWFVEKAPAMTDDADEVPIARAWQKAPLFYAIGKIYEEEGDYHNPILAAFYRDWFVELIERSKRRARNPLPRIVHVMRPVEAAAGKGRRALRRRFPDTMTDLDGNTWNILW